MNKKLKALFSLTLLLSQAAIANECNTSCEPCEQTSPFCGGYVGANFNFGSVNFLSSQTVLTENTEQVTSTPPTFALTEVIRKDSCLREAINTVGGGVTLGYAWANSCWYLAAEFNGLFYGNPNSELSDDCCDTSCRDKCCGYTSNIHRRLVGKDSPGWIDGTNTTHTHEYSNNVRLDGIAKVGFLVNPSTALYLLGGGSGLLVKYSEFVDSRHDISPSGSKFYIESHNDVSNSFCCNKWIGGGTLGAGLKSTWCNCFDLVIEARYAKYANTCYKNTKPNDLSEVFNQQSDKPAAEFSEEDNTKFKTDSYLGLVGINWRF